MLGVMSVGVLLSARTRYTAVVRMHLLHPDPFEAHSRFPDLVSHALFSDPQNDLTFLRIRSKKHEIMVAPGITFA